MTNKHSWDEGIVSLLKPGRIFWNGTADLVNRYLVDGTLSTKPNAGNNPIPNANPDPSPNPYPNSNPNHNPKKILPEKILQTWI